MFSKLLNERHHAFQIQMRISNYHVENPMNCVHGVFFKQKKLVSNLLLRQWLWLHAPAHRYLLNMFFLLVKENLYVELIRESNL